MLLEIACCLTMVGADMSAEPATPAPPNGGRIGRVNRRVNRMWRKGAAQAFGVTVPSAPPKFVVDRSLADQGYAGYAKNQPDGTVALSLSPQRVKQLSRPGKNAPGRARLARKQAKRTVLHEMAHLYQDRGAVPDHEDREGLAEMFAQQTFKRLYGHRAPGRTYRPERRAARKKYGTEFWRKAQFGSNYGKAPADIRWKTTSPPDPYREG